MSGFRRGDIHGEGEEGGGRELERPRLGVSHRMRAWRRRGARENIPTVIFYLSSHLPTITKFAPPKCPGHSTFPKEEKKLRIRRHRAPLFLHSTFSITSAPTERPSPSGRSIPTRRQQAPGGKDRSRLSSQSFSFNHARYLIALW